MEKRKGYLKKGAGGLLGLALIFAVIFVYMMQSPVQAEAASPKLSKRSATIKEGKPLTLTVKNASQKVTWRSSNSKVVRITKISGPQKAKATLKGVKKGKAKITAKVGKKKLTATITVRHVHKWVGYATCTSPDRCRTCGATKGYAMGHNWDNIVTCKKKNTCTRCKMTKGGYGAHTEGGFCRVCGRADLFYFFDFNISEISPDYLEIHFNNKRADTSMTICDADNTDIGIAYINDAGRQYKVCRFRPEDYSIPLEPYESDEQDGGYLYFRPINMDDISCSTDGKLVVNVLFRFAPTGYVAKYQLSIGFQLNDKSNYTFQLIQ